MMNEAHKILVVEDEARLAESVKNELIKNGFEAEVAFDGAIAEKLFKRNSYSLIILDINIPYINGFQLCKIIRRANANIPILMLTALDEVEDKLEAFNAGADDYLVKPFHIKELIARVNILLRRSANTENINDIIEIGDLKINFYEKKVFRAKKEIVLTVKEYNLLVELALAKGRILSKQYLTEKVWGLNFDTGTNTIEVYISFLRSKIDKLHKKKLIHTKTGFGYYLSDEA
jgi:two-component system, OmpR family, copper resistance phosphate regulon response regulator CusR